MPEDIGTYFGIPSGTVTTPVWPQLAASSLNQQINDGQYVASDLVSNSISSDWEAALRTSWDAPSTSSFGSQPVWTPLENTTGVGSIYSNVPTLNSTVIASNPNAGFVAQPLTGNEAEFQWSVPTFTAQSAQVYLSSVWLTLVFPSIPADAARVRTRVYLYSLERRTRVQNGIPDSQ
jgi:hypothetical protein